MTQTSERPLDLIASLHAAKTAIGAAAWELDVLRKSAQGVLNWWDIKKGDEPDPPCVTLLREVLANQA